MQKINNMLQGISENFKHVWSRYPVTMALVFCAAVIAACFIDQSGSLGKTMEDKVLPFTILWGIGTWFAETWFSKKKALNWSFVMVAFVIAAGLIYFSNSESGLIRETASHWIPVYVITIISLGVYGNYHNSGFQFNAYCIRVVHELSRLAIVCSIIGTGIALVMAVFVTLILNGEHFMLILRAEFLVQGILVGCGLLYAQIRLDRELPRFFIVIVKYLLMALLLTAFTIIYGYILKIIITRVVPSNEIFRILAGLFIIGLPIWTLAGTFEEDHFLVRIGVKLPYVFTPFLFLQGYAIWMRIAAYGMTPLRYLCLALMVFEIIYIIVYALRNRETGIMLLFLAALAVICLVFPGINMYQVSLRSQKAAFDRLINADFNSLPLEDQSRLAGAYYYLAGNETGQAMLAEIDPEKIEAIENSGKTGYLEYDSNMYVYYDFPVRDADISDYDRLTLISTFSYDDELKNPDRYDPEQTDFYDAAGDVVLTADISRFIHAAVSSWAANPGKSPDFDNTLELPDGSHILIYRCSMTVEPGQIIKWLDINGIWFETDN